MIPYNRQKIFKEDAKEVIKSLQNNLITTGPYIRKFEDQIKRKLKVKYASVCSSGTAALHLAIKSIETKKSDIFVLPIINFICTSNILENLGAKIYYADVDSITGQMTPKTLNECIKKNKLKKIKAFFTMYLGGQANDAAKFNQIKNKLGCYLIEDACHALGAKYDHLKKIYNIGSCKHSDICTFSLHPVKTITSGEGGIITTNNKKIKIKVDLLRSHGIIRKKNHWNYDIEFPGYNYRLSDINCALGFSQFKKIKKILNERKNIYLFYKKLMANDERVIINNISNNSAFHLLIGRINFKDYKINKQKLLNFFLNKNIYLQQHYIPVYNFSYYKKKINPKPFVGARNYFENSFSLPIFWGIKKKDIVFICNTLKQFANKNLL